jgi:succinate dehydrogenase hydrophobic anchor subunit
VISYWLITIVIPAIIYVIAIAISEENNPVLLLMLFAYYVFAFIGTWKSAGNYINKNSPPFWGYAARVVIVLSIVSFVVGILSNSK